MQVELIETFLDLMESRSFNRTAERLNLTQSTVSHRVKALEAQFNRKLFTRNKGGTVPTAAGLRFLDYAKALQNQWHEATRAVTNAGALERSMRLGVQHDLAEAFAGEWMATIRRELPGIEIYMEADYSNQMNRDLGAGELDLAILYTPHYLPDLYYERIGDLHYVMVSTEAQMLAEIRSESYIRSSYSPGFDRAHRLALPHLSAALLAAGQNMAITRLLRTLGGSAYVTAATAERLADDGFTARVQDAPVIPQTVYAATSLRTRHAHQHRKIIAAMADLLATLPVPNSETG
ncbi:LysR family transcriptional regulator [Ensifer sp. ENS07]|jgi:DNA-binding transcriptional LysR family regulator|uniref:LysR family transcriptional regulator n=1 Tax=Ensifer adhaerens TaxID=106592 RepID=A0A9Q9D855_ENSAD|nr:MULTISPECIES: LysR family transcriptional regulator [Ensifer]MBD9592043.1 LysR family transcriptional regulator [Ensifer sp. ENS05]MBD9636937.1 LysR family transcriptional regulator [Ensifer sp. ENS07]USJ22015.1 LysR family transcriptional regulator [Ensifer adhaerens]UTV35333.1 LysR family transcriptional regulator [Ensifer adhaerens]SDL36374.1 DNA-binding transcriptional regulator, LysR family [Ensifer sp. YR511]